MDLYVYKLSLVERLHDYANWDEKVQVAFKAHGEHLERHVKNGTLLIVGRTDTQLKDNFGLAIFKAKNLDEATAFMNSDPAITHGIMTASVFPFKLLVVTPEASKYNVW